MRKLANRGAEGAPGASVRRHTGPWGRLRRVLRRRLLPGSLAIALGLAVVPGCAAGHEELRREIDALRTELEELKRGDRSVAVRLDDLENRLLLMRDEVETRQTVLYRDHALSELPTVKLTPPEPPAVAMPSDPGAPFEYQTLDDYGRVTPQPAALEPAPSEAFRAPAPPPGSAHDEKAERKAAGEYRRAFELTQKGRYPEALASFREYVERYPGHQLADNALYWVGECLYAQRQYLEALQAFQRVIRDYPEGNKVPDAMLKTGLCYQSLGEKAQARKVLLQVAEIYPGSASARIALERVRAIR